MKIVSVRRISQGFFVVVFLWFCIVSTLGEKWWQLRGWPVNWLLQLDPLVALGTMITTQTLYSGLLWALLTVALTVLLGRFFCSWVCPFGSIHHFVGYLGKKSKTLSQRVALDQPHPAQSLKYYLLVGLLSAGGGELIGQMLRTGLRQPVTFWVTFAGSVALAWLVLARQAAVRRAAAVLLLLLGGWSLVGFYHSLDSMLAASLQTGLLDPIPLLHRSVNLVLLPLADSAYRKLFIAQRYYEGAWLIGTLFATVVLLNLRVPRFYCRFLCPLGALFGVLGRYALWRVGRTQTQCSQCTRCEADCEGACRPTGRIVTSECVLCMNCLDACGDRQMGYRTAVSASGETTSPDLSRRGLLVSFVCGALSIPALRLSGLVGPNWNAGVIRPPGALNENDFLKRCIKCGQCMRICPTNIIQPAGLENGLEGIWTPTLNFRTGSSGCQLNCVACSHICPTAAIRPITLQEKLGRESFAGQGPIRLGTAFVDRGRCLPWAMDKPCIVCQENCPVSPKAIFTRETFGAVRDGMVTIKNVRGSTVELTRNDLVPGYYATGDYYCQAGEDGSVRLLIIDNSSSTFTVAEDAPLAEPLQAGSTVAIQIRLQRPQVDLKTCIGCGVCEHECPVHGQRAIRVTAENESRSRKRSLLL